MDVPRRRPQRRTERIKSIVGWCFALSIIAAAMWFFIQAMRSEKFNQKIESMTPVHWLAASVFFGSLIIAGAIQRLADSFKKHSFKSDEAKAIENVADEVARLRTHGVSLKVE